MKSWQGYREERRAGRDTERKEGLAGIQGGMKSWQGYGEERRAGRDTGRKNSVE
jgi:hypothetical protein